MVATFKPDSVPTEMNFDTKNIKGCFSILGEVMDAAHIEYTHEISILRITLSNGRTQNVRGFIKKRGHFSVLVLMSKVCSLDGYAHIDYKKLITWNNHLKFSKFVIHEDYLEVVAQTRLDSAPVEYLQQVVTEVAQAADDCEHEITGLDTH
jgi:hypothetical protein